SGARIEAEVAAEREAVPAVGPPAIGAGALGIEAGLQTLVAELVVATPLLGVGERVVGERQVLERLLGARVPRVQVGMMLARELAVRLPDVVRAGTLRDAEDGVQILRLRHLLGAVVGAG